MKYFMNATDITISLLIFIQLGICCLNSVMAESQVDPESVTKILEHKNENGEFWYKIQWKDSWIQRKRLDNCLPHIESYLLEQSNHRKPSESKPVKVQTDLYCGELISNSLKDIKETCPEGKDKVTEDDENLKKKETSLPSCNVVSTKKQKDVVDNLKILNNRQPWYTNENVKKQLLKFHDEFAKTPQEDLKVAKKKHKIYIQELEDELKNLGWCKKLEYTGSAYEGLKITQDGLEFDVMFLMEGKDLEPVAIPNYEGYVNLKVVKEGKSLYDKLKDENGILLPKKMMEKFIGVVQNILNKLNYAEKIILKKHGPAVQMDVKSESGGVWYSVDLVPAIELTDNGERFVPKPLTEPDDAGLQSSWRKSFSKEEKDMLIGIDAGNGCRRQVVRILKALCKKESVLQQLNSYHLKTTLFHAVKSASNFDLSWGVTDVTERVFDMLGFLEYFLEQRNLPQYFIPSMNLFKNIKPVPLNEILNRVKVLRTKENSFMKAICF